MNRSALRFFVFLLFFSLLLGGCVYLPRTSLISEAENQAVRSRFKEMIAGQKNCHCCFDGVVKARLDNFFYAGTISGYLQARSPSFLKFMATSPLGQPLIILTSDGKIFNYVDVAKQTEYSGAVTGTTFQKYAPVGFSPEFTYYWLTGKLRPGEVSLALTSREKNGKRYWLELYSDDGRKSLVLFDPTDMHIYHHIVYNREGEVLLEMLYDKYGPEDCAMPQSVTVTSLSLSSTLHLEISDLVAKVTLSRGDFTYAVPASFQREVVE